jgi:DNA-binding Xre family transcriptional regulator
MKREGKNMTVNNRFAVLLAEKGLKEKRRISIAEVSRETGIAERTLQSWARDDIARFDAPVIEGLCSYFGCKVGDLIVFEPVQVQIS